MNKSSASSRSESRDDVTSHDNNKGLKMKIKRKAPPQQQNIGVAKPEATSSKHEIVKPGLFGSTSGGGSGSGAAADRNNDSNSNSSSSSSASSAAPTTASTVPKNANPFEKLKQAILEQTEKSKQQKQLLKAGGGSGDKDKSSKDSGGQGHGGSSGFGSLYSRGGSSALNNSNDSGLHGIKREPKSDPYEFNAKNEDRLTSGLSSTKKLKQEKEKLEMKDVMTDTSHIAIMTDPDCLGPCEPGTSVVLEGIVWQETENGLLVVNVTWRGKTYVGTLLDATKHEWAPPTFRSDSPNDPDARTPRTRGKRGRTTMNSMGGRGTRNTRNSNQSSNNNPPPSPAKPNSASIVGEKRKHDLMNEIATAASPAKKLKIDEDTPRPPNVVVEETWYVCFHVDCNKRYKEISALKYHQNHAHKTMLLSREQSSEHNKTHVTFKAASSQLHPRNNTAAAQTEGNSGEKTSKESSKKNKKSKKSKKNKTVAENAMEIDPTSANSDHVNGKQTDALQNVSNPNAPMLPSNSSKSSDDSCSSSTNVSLKQPRLQLTPLAVQQSGASASTAAKTVSAPLVSVPLATQAQTSQTSMAASAALSEKEKKRERKKRKREKKEKKLLLEQQQMHQKENGQKLVNNSGVSQLNNANALSLQNNTAPPGHIMNRSPPDGNKSRSMGVLASQSHAMPAQRQLPLNASDRNKTDDPNSKQVSHKDNSTPHDNSVHSPAYSDISDEGNDNVPVLENEVELAKKQQTHHSVLIGGASRPKETPPTHNNEQVVAKSAAASSGPGQEPPNLTPVITHTGHSKAALPTGPTQSAQMYPSNPNKDLTQSNHINSIGVRNVPPTSSTNATADLNRPRETAFANRAGNENTTTKPSPNEMHQKRAPSISSGSAGVAGAGVSQQPPHPVYASYPQGYNLNHVVNHPGNAKSGLGATAVPISPSQDRMAQQKAKEDSLKGRSIMSPNLAPTSSKLSPKHTGGMPVTSQNRLDMNSRPNLPTSSQHQNQRHVDSNMNMQQKVAPPPQMSAANGPPMSIHINKGGNPQSAPSVADINKQVATLSNAEVGKSNHAMAAAAASEPLQQSKRLTDGIISDRQSENEKILKENIELKTQMNDKDKDKSQLLYEQQQQQQQKEMQRYAAFMQQQQSLRAMQQHQFQRSRLMEQASKAKAAGDRSHTDLHLSPTKSQQPPSSQSSPHPSNVPRRDSSPMPSPKTKAELKQGERKDSAGSGKPEARTPGEHNKRPESVERNPPDGARASAMKSPGPTPSMSSPAPPPGAVPPGLYPYSYPGYVPYHHPYMFPGGPHQYMPYDNKALEMLQQQASQYYNSSQNKAQDLRKLPDRKSPNPESERSGAAPEKRESPAPIPRSPQIPHPIPGHPAVSLPQWFMPNGPVPMMQQSPQQPSSKH